MMRWLIQLFCRHHYKQTGQLGYRKFWECKKCFRQHETNLHG